MRLTTAQLMTAVRVPWSRDITDRITPPAGYTMHLWPHVGCLVLSADSTGLPLVYIAACQVRWGEIAPPVADFPSVVITVPEDEKSRRGRRAR
jgi:hypothetical protein